jgi:hypothetical protein
MSNDSGLVASVLFHRTQPRRWPVEAEKRSSLAASLRGRFLSGVAACRTRILSAEPAGVAPDPVTFQTFVPRGSALRTRRTLFSSHSRSYHGSLIACRIVRRPKRIRRVGASFASLLAEREAFGACSGLVPRNDRQRRHGCHSAEQYPRRSQHGGEIWARTSCRMPPRSR